MPNIDRDRFEIWSNKHESYNRLWNVKNYQEIGINILIMKRLIYVNKKWRLKRM